MNELKEWLDNDPANRWTTLEFIPAEGERIYGRWRCMLGSKTGGCGDGEGGSPTFAVVSAILVFEASHKVAC
jgi:hypothetical protein